MSKTYSAGIVTAYGAAKRAGYHGTYEDFCRQQAGYAENAAAVEQAKTNAINAKNDAVTAKNTAVSAKDDSVSAKNEAVSAKNTAVSAKNDAVSAKNTATTKAQEASQSATSAGQSAQSADQSARSAEQSAQDISASVQQIATNTADIGQLKADLENDSKKLLQLLNKGSEVIRWDLIYGYWDIQSGEIAFHPMSNKKFITSKYPIKVEAGDVIHILNTASTRFFATYSATANPAEWEVLTSTTNNDVTIPNAGYVLISVRNEPNSVAFTDADFDVFFDERIVIIKSNFSTRTAKRLSNSDILNGVLANKSWYSQVYVTKSEETLTINVGTGVVVACAQGDNLLIEAEITPIVHPDFVTVGLDIREQNSNGTTKHTVVTDLSSIVSYVVERADTVSVGLVITLTKVSAQSVTAGYYETVDYSLAVKKAESSNELDSVCTEAGDTWEV